MKRLMCAVLCLLFGCSSNGHAIEGPYEVYTSKSKFPVSSYVVNSEDSKYGIPVPTLEEARDLAEALNAAHERRTQTVTMEQQMEGLKDQMIILDGKMTLIRMKIEDSE